MAPISQYFHEFIIAYLVLPVFAVGSVGLYDSAHLVNLAVKTPVGDKPRQLPKR